MSTGILRVEGENVVGNDGKPIILRGAGLGGWMNMENFITGYPGHESQHRRAMKKVLGEEKYEFFFDKWLEYFFMEEDAKFYKSKGLNCLRIPFNYRHLEDDMNPRVLKEQGFKHLDRVIDLCAKEGIYTILDMHTAPGGQNPDWHSDNTTNYAAFWDFKDHQDRTVWLWEQIARRYKHNPWIAGYNPLNEPCDPEHWRLPAFYERIETAIRKIDSNHILWLDGNTFAMEWKFFDKALPNCVYALHDYSMMGFPKGERYEGTDEQKKKIERQFLRKAEFMYKTKTPIWNGEFGPVYANPELDSDHEEVNAARYKLLEQQLTTYDKYKIHWSIWLYKDIGVQGMIHVDPNSKWMKTIQPFLKRKRELQLDAWGRYPSKQVEDVINPLVDWIDSVAPTSKLQYPTPWATERQITRIINQIWVSTCVQAEFAELFRDMSFEELEECAKSFRFDQCVQRQGLNEALEAHADVGEIGKEFVRPQYRPEELRNEALNND
ncbi:glycoside hydrolase family 5 protein [Patellaria atrata CBS 101060]|uniref:Glycoside hydrolase family 5 protein n=1 Tax=Patellaria atrata CBS 101060 TaxID=1346257 RepID=A0A9P4VN55_9PEZI|nr:glycoside hydrolase family 5 protein [Patellaria atrata CBS 101060]